jgi:hypothetical protein
MGGYRQALALKHGQSLGVKLSPGGHPGLVSVNPSGTIDTGQSPQYSRLYNPLGVLRRLRMRRSPCPLLTSGL